VGAGAGVGAGVGASAVIVVVLANGRHGPSDDEPDERRRRVVA
jgi:hypothetical protein